jgi:hypothetical protein
MKRQWHVDSLVQYTFWETDGPCAGQQILLPINTHMFKGPFFISFPVQMFALMIHLSIILPTMPRSHSHLLRAFYGSHPPPPCYYHIFWMVQIFKLFVTVLPTCLSFGSKCFPQHPTLKHLFLWSSLNAGTNFLTHTKQQENCWLYGRWWDRRFWTKEFHIHNLLIRHSQM